MQAGQPKVRAKRALHQPHHANLATTSLRDLDKFLDSTMTPLISRLVTSVILTPPGLPPGRSIRMAFSLVAMAYGLAEACVLPDNDDSRGLKVTCVSGKTRFPFQWC